MFYHLDNLLSKVVTIKVVTGHEYVATLTGINEEGTVITIADPKIVVLSGNPAQPTEQEVFMVPFVLTADNPEVFLQVSQILTVMETLETTAAEYKELLRLEEEANTEQVEVELVPEEG